jgi:hypothetical protein
LSAELQLYQFAMPRAIAYSMPDPDRALVLAPLINAPDPRRPAA